MEKREITNLSAHIFRRIKIRDQKFDLWPFFGALLIYFILFLFLWFIIKWSPRGVSKA